jgi:hypothetical protein
VVRHERAGRRCFVVEIAVDHLWPSENELARLAGPHLLERLVDHEDARLTERPADRDESSDLSSVESVCGARDRRLGRAVEVLDRRSGGGRRPGACKRGRKRLAAEEAQLQAREGARTQ